MYTILCNGVEIHNPDNDLYALEAKLNLELNDAGCLSFKLMKDHPSYNDITRKSIIQVFQDDTEIFMGYPVENKIDFYNRKYVYCEGQLSFLNDSIQRPAEYHDMTVRGYLETLIAVHNQQVDDFKKFQVGMVTVTDSNDSLYRYTNWENTLTAIKEDLVDVLGGYLRIRNQDGVHYLDYVVDYGNTNTQEIEFGENLMDFVKNVDTADIATAIIPLGAKLEESSIEALEERLTIRSVNNDIDYIINEEAVNLYGKIFKTVIWDDVHDPQILKNKAELYLRETQWENTTIEVKAIDLYYSDVKIEMFKLGYYIRIVSPPHGLDKLFPLSKMTIDLTDMSKNTFTLGTTEKKSLTSDTSSSNSELLKKIEQMPTTQSIQKIINSAIDNSTEIIINSLNGFVVVNKNEILIMDTDNKETATKVWRWNSGGLGYSNTGYDGKYETAITMDGTIIGEMIAAKSITAEKIKITDLSALKATIGGMTITNDKIYGEIRSNDTIWGSGLAPYKANQYSLWVGETNQAKGTATTNAPFKVSQNGTAWIDKLYAGNSLDLYESNATWKGNLFNIFREDGTLKIKQNHHDYGKTILMLDQAGGEAQLVFNYAGAPHGTVYFYSGYNSNTYVGMYHKERNNGAGGVIWRYHVDGKFHIDASTVANAIECTTLTQTSTEKAKKDIRVTNPDEALQIIKNSRVFNYTLKGFEDLGEQTGLIIERDCPEEIVTPDGTAINLYSYVSIVCNALKALSKQVDFCANKIDILSKIQRDGSGGSYSMYEIIKSTIESRNFVVSDIKNKVDTLWVEGVLTSEQREELVQLISEYANPDTQAPELKSLIAIVLQEIETIKDRIEKLEGGNETGMEQPNIIPEWRAWDGVSSEYQPGTVVAHNGKYYQNTLDIQNTWEPGSVGIDERFWKEITKEEAEMIVQN